MAGDELNKPLGMERSPRDGRYRRALLVTFACVGLGGVGLGIGAVLVSANPRGGEPFVVLTLPRPPTSARATSDDGMATGSIKTASQAADTKSQPDTGTVENGVTVFRTNKVAGTPGGPLVIRVSTALGQSEISPTDKRLIEATRYGPLPKIGADGARPSDVYARPPVFSGTIQPGTPRIAIVIGGVGQDPAATRDAIEHLPAAVSLAVSPYAGTPDADVTRAKAVGHEVLLQLPMSGAGDDTSSPPDPHRLLSSAAPRETIDDLHWLMSRASGYAGVTSQNGGAFTTDKAAMTTLLREIGGRGLIYVDDGSSPQSLGPGLAPALGVPSAKADVVLDADADPAAVRAALATLEAVARRQGSAIGTADGRSGTLGPIAQFAESLPAKGIALVPLTTLATAGNAAVAAAP